MVLLLLALLFPYVGEASSSAGVQDGGGRGTFGVPLAIADFDGDQRPDLATVSVQQTNLHSTDYSIRFRFSGAPGSSIALTASSGGLDLSPRDVNGDSMLDLVVSTALDSKVVAVLVNDGHGNFSLARPQAFPKVTANVGAFFHAQTEWPTELTALVPQQFPSGEEAESYMAAENVNPEGSIVPEAGARPRSREFCIYLGRSPPVVLLPA
ncbi:MAG: VCBS repeat-containing protein [Candidatus Acidiferrum sp.]